MSRATRACSPFSCFDSSAVFCLSDRLPPLLSATASTPAEVPTLTNGPAIKKEPQTTPKMEAAIETIPPPSVDPPAAADLKPPTPVAGPSTSAAKAPAALTKSGYQSYLCALTFFSEPCPVTEMPCACASGYPLSPRVQLNYVVVGRGRRVRQRRGFRGRAWRIVITPSVRSDARVGTPRVRNSGSRFVHKPSIEAPSSVAAVRSQPITETKIAILVALGSSPAPVFPAPGVQICKGYNSTGACSATRALTADDFINQRPAGVRDLKSCAFCRVHRNEYVSRDQSGYGPRPPARPASLRRRCNFCDPENDDERELMYEGRPGDAVRPVMPCTPPSLSRADICWG